MTVMTQPVFPSGAAYVEALQHPELCFADPQLAAGTVETTPLGLPRPRSGAAACVFSVTTRSGTRLAVKCFTRALPDLQQRYATIAEHLAGGPAAPWQVGFDYRPRGVLVGGHWWPTVVMEWVVEGSGLAQYVAEHLAEPARLGRLATVFAQTCADLRQRHIAHGDLQHGNILVTGDERVRLVDYDGMWVPALTGRPGIERGHPHYQPPQRRVADAGPGLDHFSSWVIYICLLATAADATLWQRLDGGDDCLLLRQPDLRNPATSPAFAAFAASESELVRAAGAHLAQLCRLDSPVHAPPLDPDQLPVPTDLPEHRALPAASPPRRPTALTPVPPPGTADIPVVRLTPTLSNPHLAPTPQPVGLTPAEIQGLGISFVVFMLVMSILSGLLDDGATTTERSQPRPDPPMQMALSPDGHRAYVTHPFASAVSVIDTTSKAVIGTIPADDFPDQVVVSPDGSRAYITLRYSVSVIDTASNAVTTTIPVGDFPGQVVISPDGRHAYVRHHNSVFVIDTTFNVVTATIPVGDFPGQVVISPDGRRVYVTNLHSDSVSVIDTTFNVVTATIPVGDFPEQVAVSPDGRRAYVSNYHSDSVSVIDTTSNAVTTTIPVGEGPKQVVVAADGHRAYVINDDSDSVSVIDTDSNTVTATIPVGNKR